MVYLLKGFCNYCGKADINSTFHRTHCSFNPLYNAKIKKYYKRKKPLEPKLTKKAKLQVLYDYSSSVITDVSKMNMEKSKMNN